MGAALDKFNEIRDQLPDQIWNRGQTISPDASAWDRLMSGVRIELDAVWDLLEALARQMDDNT